MSSTIAVRETDDGVNVVEVAGEIDGFGSAEIRDTIWELCDRRHFNFVIDLDGVRYIDSAGLGVLIAALKHVRMFGGRIDLVCTNPQIKKTLGITGLSVVFKIFDSERLALSTSKPALHVM